MLTKKELAADEKNQSCLYRKKYSIQKRLQFYPFSNAKSVQLVSFDMADSLIMGGELPMKDNTIDYALLKEVKTIYPNQVDTLTDILFNWSYAGSFYSISESECYNPRNAILFIDSNGHVFAFIEICFECQGHRLSSTKVKTGDFCEQKYDYLKSFFRANGISFGITNNTTTK